MEADPLSVPLASPRAAPCALGDGQPAAAATQSAAAAAAVNLEQHSLARAQAGEIDAFRQLVRAHQAAVYSVALRLLGVREDAQELSQDVFLLLHRHLASIVSAAHLRFWLRRTACHRAIDRLRRRRSGLVALPLEAAAEIEAPGQDGDLLVDRRLRQLIARLPAMPRAVLLLRYQEDMDPPEIARALELPLNTVKSHLKRSLALLRRHGGELHLAGSGGTDT